MSALHQQLTIVETVISFHAKVLPYIREAESLQRLVSTEHILTCFRLTFNGSIAYFGLGLHQTAIPCVVPAALIASLECIDDSLIKWLDDRCTVGRQKQKQKVAQFEGSEAANVDL